MPAAEVRFAELLGALSLACDVAYGFPLEKAMRSCVLGVELGRRHGLSDQVLRDVYYTSLLSYLGCTAFAHEEALVGAGDDIATRNVLALVDFNDPIDVISTVVRRLGKGGGVLQRARAALRFLGDRTAGDRHRDSICEVSVHLAGLVGVSAGVRAALTQICERWDGKTGPRGVAGEALHLPSRIDHVAGFSEIAHHRHGRSAALALVRKRAGAHFDPALAKTFAREAEALFASIEGGSIWERFLDAEPAPRSRVDEARIDDVARAFAELADLKSVWTLGHSTGVAALATRAAEAIGLSEEEQKQLRRAALLHDLGRVSAPNRVWDKPGKLSPSEWEVVRMHTYWTERILSRSPYLREAAQLASAAHERLDGAGYHRAVPSAMLSRSARILAAADAYHAMREDRPYRSARSAEQAAEALLADVAAGGLDREAAHAVLDAAGVGGPRAPAAWPCSLSDREVEVLRLLARGRHNKEIAVELGISPRTAQHHVIHIYQKIGVASRAAAALFAIENGLLDPPPSAPSR